MSDPMPEPERWLPMPFPGFGEAYFISNQGRAWSVRGRKILKPGFANGYPTIFPQVGRLRRKVYLHRAVAAAFLGPCPPGQEVRHRDGDRLNCRLSNLEYGTSSENQFDKVRHGRHHMARRDRCGGGHPYTENTSYWNGKQRICRICRREKVAAWKQRNPEAAAAARAKETQRKRDKRAAARTAG